MLLNMRVSQLLSLALCTFSCMAQGIRHRKKAYLYAGAALATMAVVCMLCRQTYLIALPAAGFAGVQWNIQKKASR